MVKKVYDFVVTDRQMVADGSGFHWRSYTDKVGAFGNPGSDVRYNDGAKDKQGVVIGKAFSLDQSHYKLMATDAQKDYDGKYLYIFFQNSPFCLGSPNGSYTNAEGEEVYPHEVENITKNLLKLKAGELKQAGVKYKLMDDELDAQMALETGLKRAEAQISSSQIDEQTLAEIAALTVGLFGTPDKIMRHKVYEFAGRKPIDYFKLLESGDRAIRAVIRKALADGVFTQKGSVIFWDSTIMGNDENAVVAHLLGDASILKALQEKVDFKTDKKPSAKKK